MSRRSLYLAILVHAVGCASCSNSPGTMPSNEPPGGSSPSIRILPASPLVEPGTPVNFVAVGTETQSLSVQWAVQEAGGGSIDDAGRYVAPGTIGEFHVVATSTAGDGMQAVATVSVAEVEPGTWVDVSPPADYAYYPIHNYGFISIVGTPLAPGVLYAGIDKYDGAGIWKSTDGGSSWVQVNETFLNGGNGLALDPTDVDTIYSHRVYGSGGVVKSTDGGVTWVNIQNNPVVGGGAMTNSVGGVKIDPADHLHVFSWSRSGAPALYESFDGGEHWYVHTTVPGQGAVFPLGQDDAGQPSTTHWLLETSDAGIWRTTTGGRVGGTAAQQYRDGTPSLDGWTQVLSENGHHGAAGFTRLADGWILMGVGTTIQRSKDNGVTWEDLAQGKGYGNLATTGASFGGLVSDGTLIWTMRSNTGVGTSGTYTPVTFPAVLHAGVTEPKANYGYRWVTTSASGDGSTWTETGTQTFNDGPANMYYDPVNRTLYAANWCTGLFRLKQ